MEAVAGSACGYPFCDEPGGRGQDDCQVRHQDVRVQVQQELQWYAVELLHDERRGEVPVAEHDVAGVQSGLDLVLDVLVPVRRDQAGQGVPADVTEMLPDEGTEFTGGGFHGLVDNPAASG